MDPPWPLASTELGSRPPPSARFPAANTTMGTAAAATTPMICRRRSARAARTSPSARASPAARPAATKAVSNRVSVASTNSRYGSHRGPQAGAASGWRARVAPCCTSTTAASTSSTCSVCSIPTTASPGRNNATTTTIASSGARRLGWRTLWLRPSTTTTPNPAATLSTSGTHSSAPAGVTARPAATSRVHRGADEADSNDPAATPQVPWRTSLSAMLRWMAGSSRT